MLPLTHAPNISLLVLFLTLPSPVTLRYRSHCGSPDTICFLQAFEEAMRSGERTDSRLLCSADFGLGGRCREPISFMHSFNQYLSSTRHCSRDLDAAMKQLTSLSFWSFLPVRDDWQDPLWEDRQGQGEEGNPKRESCT